MIPFFLDGVQRFSKDSQMLELCGTYINALFPQRQLRKRKCYLLLVGTVVLIILIIIIAVSTRK